MPAEAVRQFKKENKETYSCGKEPFTGAPSNVLNLNA
jgi:hypothetical protein